MMGQTNDGIATYNVNLLEDTEVLRPDDGQRLHIRGQQGRCFIGAGGGDL